MANIPLKTIKFPGLDDTYTIPQVDATLTNAGQAADAAATKAALGNKADNTDLGTLSNLTTSAKGSAVAAINEINSGLGSVKADLENVDAEINTGISTLNYIEDKNIDATTGDLVDEAGTCVSEKIPYTWTGNAAFDVGDNTKLTYRVEFYDTSDNHLGGYRVPVSTGGITYRVVNIDSQSWVSNVSYVRFSFKKAFAGHVYASPTVSYWLAQSVQVPSVKQMIGELDNLNTANKSSLIDAVNEVRAEIPDIALPIQTKDTSFFHTASNLVNPDTAVDGEYVNQASGDFASNTNHRRTDYIKVGSGQSYLIKSEGGTAIEVRYAFYDSTKAFVPNSGSLVSGQTYYIVTAPANAVYAVVSASKTVYPLMLAQSDTDIPYDTYGDAYILPKYIKTNENLDDVLNIPSKIYAVTGIETNVYFENITEDYTKFDWDVTCSKGMQLERGYRVTPTDSDAGSYPLTIKATLKTNKSLTMSKTATLVISASTAGSGTTKTVIVLGDSTTNAGKPIESLVENFSNDGMTVTPLGTRGTAPYKHEGRSGWRLETYFTTQSVDYTDGRGHVENPFYNPTSETFDADYYFANSGVAKPDWFIVNMGINDVFSPTNDSDLESIIDTCLGYLDSIVSSVGSASPNTKIGICLTIPPNHSQDAFGKAYSCGQTRDRYKRNNTLWVHDVIEHFTSNASVYLIPINSSLDTIYNMGMEALPVNARNTDVTCQSPIGNGGVHPVASGYWQIADVYTAFLKANA